MTAHLVSSITRTNVPILAPDTPIRRAIAQLVEGDWSAAPVVSESGSMCGILTQKDCFQPALHASYYREWSGCVGDYMSTEVISVDINEDAIRVAEMFIQHPHRVFPVLDGSKVAGLVHRSDVLALLVKIG